MKRIFTILAFLLLALSGFAQISMSPNPTFAQCPGVAITYSANNSVTNSCIFDWTVTNGSIQGGFQNGNVSTFSGGNLATITWFDVTQSGQIKIQARDCSPSSGNTSELTFTYAILSINGVNPGAISGASSVTVNVTSNQTYSVPQINFPNIGSGDVNPKEVNSYEWQIPSGWTVVSGGSTKSITVKPDNCSGGTIKVRGKNTTCTGNTFFSNFSPVKTITRTLATPGTITGPDAVNCTDTSVKTYSISAVAGATSYTWTNPNNWTGTSTTTSINLTPNGLNGGTVTVKANGCSIQSSASSKTITVNLTNPNSPPSVSGSSPVCFSGTTFNLSNLPAYASVSWTQSSNLTTVSGQGTTNYTVRANSTSTSGAGWVDATISTPCGTAPPIRYNVWVGKPYDFLVSGPTVVPAGSYNNYSAVEWNQQPSFSGQGVNSNGFAWSFGYPPTSAGWNCFGCAGQTVLIQAGSQSTYVTGQVTNTCGSTQRNYEVFIDCPTNDCIEPFFVYPNPSSEELTISSNSATDSNLITEISLMDSNGTVVYSEKTRGRGQVKISVRGYKNGTYYLSINESGVTKKRQIIINH